MKAFVISLVAIIIVILLVIFNCIYVLSTVSKLTEMAKGLEFENYDDFDSLKSYWDKHHFWLCLSSTHEKTDKVEECLRVLGSKYDGGESEGFYEYKALLLHYIEEIERVQELSLDVIV